jgi:DNA-3-methyladenine glycosylase II
VLLELDSVGSIGGEKMERLHGIAEAALAGRLDRARLRSLPFEEATADMQTLRGVGPFIAQGIVLRGAGVVDGVASDEVTRQAVQRAYELSSLPDPTELERIAEPWRPYRMWCCVLLHLWLRSGAAGSYQPVGRARGRS